MELEDITIDFDYATKIRSLGINKKSLFYWYCKSFTGETKLSKKIDGRGYTCYPAFTTDELLEMLPDEILLDGRTYYVEISKHIKIAAYREPINNQMLEVFGCKKKLPNALAKLLIWCIENNYVEVKQ